MDAALQGEVQGEGGDDAAAGSTDGAGATLATINIVGVLLRTFDDDDPVFGRVLVDQHRDLGLVLLPREVIHVTPAAVGLDVDVNAIDAREVDRQHLRDSSEGARSGCATVHVIGVLLRTFDDDHLVRLGNILVHQHRDGGCSILPGTVVHVTPAAVGLDVDVNAIDAREVDRQHLRDSSEGARSGCATVHVIGVLLGTFDDDHLVRLGDILVDQHRDGGCSILPGTVVHVPAAAVGLDVDVNAIDGFATDGEVDIQRLHNTSNLTGCADAGNIVGVLLRTFDDDHFIGILQHRDHGLSGLPRQVVHIAACGSLDIGVDAADGDVIAIFEVHRQRRHDLINHRACAKYGHVVNDLGLGSLDHDHIVHAVGQIREVGLVRLPCLYTNLRTIRHTSCAVALAQVDVDTADTGEFHRQGTLRGLADVAGAVYRVPDVVLTALGGDHVVVRFEYVVGTHGTVLVTGCPDLAAYCDTEGIIICV